MSDLKRQLSLFRILSLVLAGVVIGGLVMFFVGGEQLSQPADSFTSSAETDYASIDASEATPPDASDYWVVNLAKQSLPFVVNVRTSVAREEAETDAEGGQNQNQNQQEGPPQGSPQNPFDLFPFEDMPQTPQGEGPLQRGEGSGFIVSEDGYIVTNWHVISAGNEYTITLNDGTELDAEKVGSDPLKDIAVLKVDPDRSLPYAPLGDSDNLQVGEPAVAIGSPFGLQHTVTAGIISAVNRTPEEVRAPNAGDPRGVSHLIQTDASINRGNSGGPLLNAEGKVIGINEAIIPNADRIGFAIAINDVKETIQQLKESGDVQYPGLGVQIVSVSDLAEIDPELANSVGVDYGVFVRQVNKGSAADRAGIQAGDVILELDGNRVEGNQDIITQLTQREVGDRVRVTVARNGNADDQAEVIVVLQALDTESFGQQQQQPRPIPIP